MMLHTHARRLPGALILLILLPLSAAAQQYGNSHPFDFKRFNLGFLMGLNYNTYNLNEQINILENGVLLRQVELVPRVGLSLGMISSLKLHNQISLRAVPTISLEQRDFRYNFARDSVIMRKIEASYINLPVMFQFKTGYWNATRTYLLAGGQWGVNLNNNKRVLDDRDLLKIEPHDFSLVFGWGINLYGERIKLSPEIRYTMGLIDLFVRENTTHTAAIERLSSQVLTINVNFE
jgi:hypothetical protein